MRTNNLQKNFFVRLFNHSLSVVIIKRKINANCKTEVF
nr:MAG TPA: hypothetical protein [Caudoviricetes sp.]